MKVLKRIIPIIVAIILIISTGVLSRSASRALADTALSEVEAELNKMTIDGKAFNEADYPTNPEGSPQLLLLNERGYCKENTDLYALTLYIYNPAQLDIRKSKLNTAQMQFEENTEPKVFDLSLTSISEDKRFVRFIVSFKGSERSDILATLSGKTERVYDVNSLDLHYEGFNATAFTIERKFIYKGYYSDDLTCSLNYTVAGGTDTVSLECKHTTWRPKGTNGKSDYTHDSITSVYFAVPKEFDKKYDWLEAVHCRWLEAFTAPMLVTDSDFLIDRINKAYDATLLETEPNELFGRIMPEKFNWNNRDFYCVSQDFANDTADIGFGNFKSFNFKFKEKQIERMPFYIKMNDTKNYTVSSERLLEGIRQRAEPGGFFNDMEVAGKYPSWLFESWADDFHEETIPVGKEYKLYSEEVRQHWWEKLFGGSHIENPQTYKNIQAIYPLSDVDFIGSIEEVCNNLYIGKQDFDDFKKFYKAKEQENTVYLLRIATSDYYSRFMDIYERRNIPGTTYAVKMDSHTYISQETFYLDFDIIDLQYMKADKLYIIPVTMSPIDITPGLDPPPFEENEFWKTGFIIIGALAGVAVVYGILKKAVKK